MYFAVLTGSLSQTINFFVLKVLIHDAAKTHIALIYCNIMYYAFNAGFTVHSCALSCNGFSAAFRILCACVDSYVYTLHDIPEVRVTAANNWLVQNTPSGFSPNISIYIHAQLYSYSFFLLQCFIQRKHVTMVMYKAHNNSL
jgi:hypothetical protein